MDGAFDQIAWDPVVSYLDVSAAPDVNNLDAHRYQASADFTLAGRTGLNVIMPFTGTVRLSSVLAKRARTSDDITVLVLRNGIPVSTNTLTGGETAIIGVNADLVVARGDTIQLRVKVDSPIDATQIAWLPRLFYLATADVSPIVDADGNPLVDLHPPYEVDIYPGNDLTAPQAAWTVPASGTVLVTPQVSPAAGANGTVTFTVKRRVAGAAGQLLAKRAISITDGVAGDGSVSLDVTAGDELFFDFSVADPA